MANKEWVVVTFIDQCDSEEEQTSEMPTNWLIDSTKCFWPTVKNISNLIKNRSPPEPGSSRWKIFNVRVEAFCDSLKNARKKASTFSSGDESQSEKGRGCREKRKTLKAIEEEKSTSSDESILDSAKMPVYPSQMMQNTDMEKNVCKAFSDGDADKSLEESSTRDNDEILREAPNVLFDDVPIQIVDKPTVELLENMKNFLQVEFTRMDSLLREVNHNLGDINRRMEHLENALKLAQTKCDMDELEPILNILPLKTKEDLDRFEESLNSKNIFTNLVIYFSNIGGSGVKDNIVRIMRRVFSNELAVKCSWLGLRNNIKICNLHTVELIKRTVSKKYQHSEKELEIICSDWLRQAKLRLTRETRKLASAGDPS